MDSYKRKLYKIQCRYFPPGLILEFKDSTGMFENKAIDLLNLSEKYIIPLNLI